MPNRFDDIGTPEHRRRRRRPQPPAIQAELLDPSLKGYAPRIRQWLLRTLVDCGGLHAEHIDIERTIKQSAEIFDSSVELANINEVTQFVESERKALSKKPARVSGHFANNLKLLQKTLALSPVEVGVFGFLIIYRQYIAFQKVVDMTIMDIDGVRLCWQLSQILGLDRSEIEAALKPDSGLLSAGLVAVERFDRRARKSIGCFLTPQSRISQMLITDNFSLANLLNTAVRPLQSTELVMEDYDFMADQRDLVHRLLTAVKSKPDSQVSILLDGPPGVGKTQFARMIAQTLEFEAYEINEFDEDGDPASVDERLKYLMLAQKIMSKNCQHLLVMDEADALLGGSPSNIWNRRYANKASILRMLDTLEVPTIWITNHGDSIHPAVARRLDLTIRFKSIPKDSLEKMLIQSLPKSNQLPPWTKTLIGHPNVTPARIAQASQAAKLMAQGNAEEELELFKQVISENLEIRGLDGMEHHRPTNRPYRPEIVNASEDLGIMTESLQQHPNARLCLYGPPGTGKTAYAHYLAEQCGLKLAEYRASDILSCWVGGSEENIRNMFRECNNDKTLLFLDEADSLFRSRAHATRNFEVNQVNELLKGLEEHSGLFVASTNLMEQLDPAVMRRIDFKVHLGFLKPDQAWILFQDMLAELKLTMDDEEASHRALSQLAYLTPGDFATVSRRCAINHHIKNPKALIDQLYREVSVKPEIKQSSRIGFTAHIAA
jgi:SpoVK/Ycf46/Vps4 family AAA+-type ATPase